MNSSLLITSAHTHTHTHTEWYSKFHTGMTEVVTRGQTFQKRKEGLELCGSDILS